MKKGIYGLFCCLFISLIAPANATPFTGKILRCHDGDTCLSQTPYGKIRIRLHLADSPEIRVPGKWPTQLHAFEARAAINSLIAGQTVTINPVDTSFDRIVADISIAGMDVAHELVREGWAIVDPCFSHDPSLQALQDEASANGRGIWADPVQNPWDWREEHQYGHPRLHCPRSARK